MDGAYVGLPAGAELDKANREALMAAPGSKSSLMIERSGGDWLLLGEDGAVKFQTQSRETAELVLVNEMRNARKEAQAGESKSDVRSHFETDLLTGENAIGTVFENGPKFTERLLQDKPISGTLEAVERSNYRARFALSVDGARERAESLGGELRFLPASDTRLIFASHERDGRITLNVHPRAFDTLMELAHSHKDAFLRLADDVLIEEVLHVADLSILRDEWLKFPKNGRGSFDEFVRADRKAIFSEIRMARDGATTVEPMPRDLSIKPGREIERGSNRRSYLTDAETATRIFLVRR